VLSDEFRVVGPPIEVVDPRGSFEVEPSEQRGGTWRFTGRGPRSNAVGADVG
jgi:hypothetical protein